MNTTVETIKRFLLRRRKQVEEEIKSIEKDDPVLSQSTVSESSEPGTDSWMADVHGRAMVIKQSLQVVLGDISYALTALKSGRYGKCENCGQPIEGARLRANPLARACLNCAKKALKNKKYK